LTDLFNFYELTINEGVESLPKYFCRR